MGKGCAASALDTVAGVPVVRGAAKACDLSSQGNCAWPAGAIMNILKPVDMWFSNTCADKLASLNSSFAEQQRRVHTWVFTACCDFRIIRQQ